MRTKRTAGTKAELMTAMRFRNDWRAWPWSLALGSLGFCACSSSGGSPSGGALTLELTSALAGAPAGPVTVGAPCDADQPTDPTFSGSADTEISVDTLPNAPSGAPVCLVYHFTGLVSCPYGQDSAGAGPDGGAGCVTPGGMPVTAAVSPQCADRSPANTVFWSCRCADVDGATGNATYCACPSGMSCTPTISPIGGSGDTVAGSYCLPPSAAYDPTTACSVKCDPTTHPCP